MAAGAWAVARCATTPPGRRPASVGRPHGAGRSCMCCKPGALGQRFPRRSGSALLPPIAGSPSGAPRRCSPGCTRNCWTCSAPLSDRLVPGVGGQHARPGGQKGDLTGPSPVDRGKPGSKVHAMSERSGIPLTVVISAANRNDHRELETVIDAVAPVRGLSDGLGVGRASCTRTRATTIRPAETRCVGEESSPGSLAGVSSRPPGWGATATSSNAPWSGFPVSVDWLAATSARPPTMRHSPAWPAR